MGRHERGVGPHQEQGRRWRFDRFHIGETIAGARSRPIDAGS
jgi:hypothetical protein